LPLNSADERLSLSFKAFGCLKHGKEINCVFLRMRECGQPWAERVGRRDWEGKRGTADSLSPRNIPDLSGDKQRHLSTRNGGVRQGGMATQLSDVIGLGCQQQAGGTQKDCTIWSVPACVLGSSFSRIGEWHWCGIDQSREMQWLPMNQFRKNNPPAWKGKHFPDGSFIAPTRIWGLEVEL